MPPKNFKAIIASVSAQLPRGNALLLRALRELWAIFVGELQPQRLLRVDLHSSSLFDFRAEQTLVYQTVIESIKKE